MSTLKRFAGQTAIYGLTTIASRVLNFFLTPIYVRQFPAHVYGVFTTMYSWASLVNAFLAFGMETTFFRYLIKYQEKKEAVYANAFLAVTFLAGIFLALALIFAPQLAYYMHPTDAGKQYDYEQYIRLFAFISAIDAVSVIPFAKIRADGRPIRYGWIKCLNIFVFIGFNLLFIFVIPAILRNHSTGYNLFVGWFRPGWVGYVFVANLIASSITLLMLLPELFKLKLQFNKFLFFDMLGYSWPVLLANISFIINENVDKIFLGSLLPPGVSEQQVGIYGACSKLPIFLSIFVQAFRLGAEPFYFSQAKKENATQIYARIMDYFILAILVVIIALVANMDILKYFIKGSDAKQQALYWSALTIVPVLLYGYLCLGVYMNLSVWYKLSDQTRYGLYISLFGAVITVGLNLIYIPIYGFIAAAWIALAARFGMMILSYLLGQKNYPIPYQLGKNLAYIGLSIICVVICQKMGYGLLANNAVLLLFIGLVVFMERNELKKVWNQISK